MTLDRPACDDRNFVVCQKSQCWDQLQLPLVASSSKMPRTILQIEIPEVQAVEMVKTTLGVLIAHELHLL
jgi:hypothetical protein